MNVKRNITIQAFLLLVGIVTQAPSVWAGHFHRDACFTRGSEGQRGRVMGERNANRLYNSIWNHLNRSCDQMDRLVNIIADTPLAPPANAGRDRASFQACFYQGYVETLFGNLNDTSARCEDKCFQAGNDIGEISAQGYCAASSVLGGLDDPGFISQPALPLCGFNVVMGCKSEYVYTATYAFPGCRRYTEGSFTETFDNTVRQDCFVPSDVPIRDSSYLN